MTEKYLVEVDIENPYFYGCGKPFKKKTNLHFWEEIWKTKNVRLFILQLLRDARFYFFKFPPKNILGGFWAFFQEHVRKCVKQARIV